MNEAIQKFKEMVACTNSIVVALGTTDNITKLLSATILHQTFVELGKESSLDINFVDEKTRRFIEALCGNITQSKQKEHLVIKLDSKSMPISELQYEKVGNSFNIILDGAGSLNPDNIKIEKVFSSVGLLMLIDPQESEVELLCDKTPHKEVIKLSSKERSVAIKAFDIVCALFTTIPTKIATPLLYLISQEEKEFGTSTQKTLEAKQFLLESGANQQIINAAHGEFLGSGFWKLFGRALARSEFEKRLGTVWSFLPLSDFKKTGKDVAAITRVFDELRALRSEARFVALLWEESPKKINALVGGSDTTRLLVVATEMQTQLSSTYFLLHGFETFSEAELKIRSHIQRVL